jgi:serine protease Do
VLPPTPTPKLLHALRTRVIIAISSLLLLGAGALLRPQPSPGVLQPPQEHSAPLLEAEVQRRAPFRAFAGLQDVGSRAAAHAVAIPPAALPSTRSLPDFPIPAREPLPLGFGVIVSPDGDVLTHASALGGRSTLNVQVPGGGLAEARLSAYEPATGLVILRLAPPPVAAGSPVRIAAASAGSLAAAVGRWNGETIIEPLFITALTSGMYSISGGATLPGAPIFSVDGDLLAVVATNADRVVAYPAQGALRRLRAEVAAGRGRPASLGLVFQPIDDALARALGGRGALVTDVVGGGAAAAAGIRPGDVVIAIGSVPVDSVEAARNAIAGLVPASVTTVSLRRSGKTLSLDVAAGAAFAVAAARTDESGPRVLSSPETTSRGRGEEAAAGSVRADAVFTPAELRAANVPDGAFLLALDGEAIESRAQAVRLARRRTAATVLYLQHDGHRFFVALPPPS